MKKLLKIFIILFISIFLFKENVYAAEWIGECHYKVSFTLGSMTADLYFNRETFEFNSDIMSGTYITDIELDTLLNYYDSTGKCVPFLYYDANISTFKTEKYSGWWNPTLEEYKLELVDATYNHGPGGDPSQIPDPEIPSYDNCESLFGDPKSEGTPAFYMTVAFRVVRYVAIIILVLMSVLDFVSATAASDNDALKKATNKLIKRAILCVIIFVLPTIIAFVLTYLNDRAVDMCIGR